MSSNKKHFKDLEKKTNDIIKDISNIQMQNVERRPDIKESIQNIKQLMSQIYDIDQHWNDIKNLIEKNNTDVNLKPNVDAKINELEEHKKQIIKFRETTNKYIIYSNIPKPIYWTTKPKIFNSEYIENIVNNNANNTFTAIKHICKLDSNGLKSILSEGIDTRNNYLKEAAQKLSDEFQKNFKMNYTFVLQFNTDDVGNKINLTIMDPITKVEINVVKRSEGLQWILDFYFKMINLTATMSSLTSKILLLDNPAIPIHDIAKEKIRKYIKKLSEEENLQIVYTSHERALVDATNMQNIRLIKKTEKGTVNIKTHDRLPHRIELAQHIGSPGRYGLFGIPFTIFVEGMSDVNILKAFNHLAQKNNKSYLDPNLFAFDDLDGIGNLKYLHKLYDNFNMPCCFIIDSDAEQFKEKYKAFDNKIISIQGYTICKLPNSTIEDMFTSDMYKKLLYYFLDSEYITKLNNVCINEGNTILNLFEISMKKVNISKFDISKQFLLNIDKLWVEPNNKIQIEKSLENYYKLVEKIKTLFDTYMT